MRAAVALCLLGALVAPAAGAQPPPALPRVSAFYYPWYGTPVADGGYAHWQQNGHEPPWSIASAFYPARGPYSSSDRRVLEEQMRELDRAGVDQVIASWWGRGSPEDARLQALIETARRSSLEVAVHVEPYGGRTPASVEGDAAYLAGLGISELYVYGPTDTPAEEWAALNDGVPSMRIFAQTALAGFAAAGHFDGLYTYDILVFGGGRFGRLCLQARRRGLRCAPSVGPGYDASRAVGDARLKPRRDGRTYDAMWSAALHARADAVTITSYNEWHEGTQIEPARATALRDGRRYAGYDGAYGARGRAAESAYLDRTAYWSARFAAGASANVHRGLLALR
ncbi:MAG: alpha-mannosidase [Actinobacteria bacterium]|nr:alpha-mannosidase [Actinomycetota bacterium]